MQQQLAGELALGLLLAPATSHRRFAWEAVSVQARVLEPCARAPV